MNIMLDLNILLDVVQKRQPHYLASAGALDYAFKNQCGVIPAHSLTTLYYLVSKYADKEIANDLLDWLLQNFHIAEINKDILLLARKLNFNDFEDAVVSAGAEKMSCQCIITRNRKDFKHSRIKPLAPDEFLALQQN